MNSEMEKQLVIIEQFHVLLNDISLLPADSYRRNHLNYPLVSYVNNIVALFISKNYDCIPVFIKRAYKEYRLEVQGNIEDYRELTKKYLAQVTFFLISFTAIDKENVNVVVPKEILEMGQQDILLEL